MTKSNFLELILRKTSGKTLNKESLILDEIKTAIRNQLISNDRLVFVFNRFDYLEPIYSQNFFDNLRLIRDIDRAKITMVFASSKPIYEIAPNYLRDCYSLFSVVKYLKPYSQEDLRKIMGLDKSELLLDKSARPKAMRLSGGHHSLLQNLIRCQSLDNPLGDPMVNLMIKEIYGSLNYKRQNILKAIVMGKNPNQVDKYLIDIGFVNKARSDYFLFTPLLHDFVSRNSKARLPSKERRLFKILENNAGKIVPKDEIIEFVWGVNYEDVSDWALNSLIYRLRKNRTFQDSGYTIESHKSDGYSLQKI